MDQEKTVGTIIFDLYETFKHRCQYYYEDEGECSLLGPDDCNDIDCPFLDKITDAIDLFSDPDKEN